MVKANDEASLEFKWLKKRGVGGKKKEIRFYESFIYDGAEYTLYDCVYMYKEGLPEPYLGKLIKIWEDSYKRKKVKIHWFFRVREILKWLGDNKTLENEIFLASGEGVGITNINPLDKNKWFRTLPWEERMKNAHDQGILVLLLNLDPEYTSEEVEDIIWHAFKETCTAKMVHFTAISSRHSGQALVIFKTKEAAERVLTKLDVGCLLLSNGRPIVGTTLPPSTSWNQSTFFGHLAIDNIKTQREAKDAVSTSHCSQPNTIEYEMAMEWCLIQSRSNIWWKKLHKQQREELRKLQASLSRK